MPTSQAPDKEHFLIAMSDSVSNHSSDGKITHGDSRYFNSPILAKYMTHPPDMEISTSVVPMAPTQSSP